MKKYQVFCDNYEGNYYSFFVKAYSVGEAMSLLWDRIKPLNLTTKNYSISVREIRKGV